MQRRRLLHLTAGGAVGTLWWRPDRVRASEPDGSSSEEGSSVDPDEFDPEIHGFGFSNWAGNTGRSANNEVFTYEPGEVTQEDVRQTIDDSWTTAISEGRETLIARIVYSWIGGNAATNGHCYGMALSADGYFRHPSELPASVGSASEIPRPTGENDAVADRIRRIQTSQILRAELFWYAFFGLRWGLADHRESLAQLTEAIDANGTAGLTLDGEAGAHQVLAYRYERSDGVTDVFVYDPNYEADDHEDPDDVWTLSVDRESGEVLEIEDRYDHFLFHDPHMDPSVVDRLIGGRNRVLDELSNAVFLGLEAGDALEIDVPGNVLVDRPTAEYADPKGSRYADAAVVFGSLNEFEISIDGEAGGEYSLDTVGLRDGDLIREDVISGRLDDVPTRLRFTIDEAGELVVDIIEAAEERVAEATDGETAEGLGETSDGADGIEDSWLITAAVGALGLGLGGAYRLLAHRTDNGDET